MGQSRADEPVQPGDRVRVDLGGSCRCTPYEATTAREAAIAGHVGVTLSLVLGLVTAGVMGDAEATCGDGRSTGRGAPPSHPSGRSR